MPSGGTGTTGISDSMTPGDIGDLVLFTEPAFRVRFDGDQPPSSQLYWRGLVFSDFDGLTWTRNESFARQRFMNDSDVEYLGPSYSYELLLEPTRRNWLYALEMPLSMSPVGRMTTDYTWIRRFPVNNKLTYEVVSFPESEFGLELDDISREINLALPDGFNPVSREWAENLRATMNSDQGFVQEVLKYINQQQYHYTLSPGTMGENGVDDFWFNKQRGFCEHYAGAFVFMMRSAGIPARVVTGYQGGEMNPFGDYMIVRQSDAHAWTEVWLEGQGWKRIDPTAAIHPSRVEVDLSQDWMQRDAIFNDEAPGDWSEFKPSWVSQISLMWDSLNSQWQESVIDYSSEKQYQMLRNMGLDHFTMSDLLNMMLIVAGVFSMISGYLMLRKRPRLDDVAKVYVRLNKKLSRNNLSRQANEGPWQHWRRIKEVNPQLADKIRPAIKLYVQLRYQAGVEQKPELLRSFKQRVSSL
jgi:transglutaminase-like putative cysteine protease